MKLGPISTSQLFNTKKSSLGLIAFGLYLCFAPFLLSGTWDYANLVMGLTFIACALILAIGSPRVFSGLLVGFVGVVNLLTIANVFDLGTAWMLTLVCIFGLIFLEYAKFGKASKKAQTSVIVPMVSLFFMFLLALVGLNPVMQVDWATSMIKAINYVALMFFTGLLSFEFLGWKIMKKNQGLWITVLGLFCVVTSFLGVYYGTLAW